MARCGAAAVIEFRQLRYLLAAAEAGSFSRAARSLNIKQSTLSRHILQIEKRLGITLFDRLNRGSVLTQDGRIYVRAMQRIMQDYKEVNDWVLATRAGKVGRLTVGFYTSFSAGNLRATLAEFSDRYPDVAVRGFQRDRDLLVAGIENGLLDLAVMIGEIDYPGIKTRPFWSERVLAALPENHPLSQRERIFWSDLASERFLLTTHDPGPETRNTLLGKLGGPGVQPRIEMDDIDRATVLAAVALGRHLSIVAESALGFHYPGVTFREIHENGGHYRTGFSGYWRSDNDSPVLRRFLDFVAARYSLPAMRD